MAVLLWEKLLGKVRISLPLSHFDYPFSMIVNAFFWGLVMSSWENNTCRHLLLRLGFFYDETQWRTFQTWDLNANERSKAPEGEEGQGTLIKHAKSDHPLILSLICCSATKLVISFSSNSRCHWSCHDAREALYFPLCSTSWKILPHCAMQCFLRVLEK